MKKLSFFTVIFMITTVLFCSCSENLTVQESEIIKEEKYYASVSADDYIYNDVRELVNDATFIVKGKVIDVKPSILFDGYTLEDLEKENFDKYGAPLTSIFTPYVFEIVETYYGEISEKQQITLYMPYGEINGYILYSDSFPKFQLENEYVLLLNKANYMVSNGEYSEEYMLVTPEQGWIPTQINLDAQRAIHENKSLEEEAISSKNNISLGEDTILNMDIFDILFENYTSIEDVVNEIKNTAEQRK